MRHGIWRIKEWQNSKRINSVFSSMVYEKWTNHKSQRFSACSKWFWNIWEKETFRIANRQQHIYHTSNECSKNSKHYKQWMKLCYLYANHMHTTHIEYGWTNCFHDRFIHNVSIWQALLRTQKKGTPWGIGWARFKGLSDAEILPSPCFLYVMRIRCVL